MFWPRLCYIPSDGVFTADCSPEQFDTRLALQLSPELVVVLHHAGVKVMVVGLADDAGLAVGATSAVGQDELQRRRNKHIIQAIWSCKFDVKKTITKQFFKVFGPPPYAFVIYSIMSHS